VNSLLFFFAQSIGSVWQAVNSTASFHLGQWWAVSITSTTGKQRDALGKKEGRRKQPVTATDSRVLRAAPFAQAPTLTDRVTPFSVLRFGNWIDDARQLPVPIIPQVTPIGLKLLGDGNSHLIDSSFAIKLLQSGGTFT
jgi:hypothetical protein